MATPKKTASGKWSCKVYDYTDSAGKRHYRSITADTKKECTYQAASFAANKKRILNGDLTVGEALDQYIDEKRDVLSASTIRGYLSQRRNYYSGIENIRIRSLTDRQLQEWVGSLSKHTKPKTVNNAKGLLFSAISSISPGFSARVTLPARIKPSLYMPSDSDIKKLISSIEDPELLAAVLLAAFGPMRRGEICALTDADIKGNTVSVSKSMVRAPGESWIIKQPKTYSSYRTILFPDFVIGKLSDLIRDNNDHLFTVNPDSLSCRFRRQLVRCGLPHFRFHDLRHYSASIMHAIGIPDQYIMQRGGWATDNVMKTVYLDTMDEQTKTMTVKINQYFSDMQP